LESVTIVLMLMVAVVISGIVARMVPVPLPRPLFQIALGALIGLIADWRVTLDPEIFFLLFLPPLLFLDGWRIPREELFKDGRTVLGLALGLVVFTVVGMGFFIHWMIPRCRFPSLSRWPRSSRRPTRSPVRRSLSACPFRSG